MPPVNVSAWAPEAFADRSSYNPECLTMAELLLSWPQFPPSVGLGWMKVYHICFDLVNSARLLGGKVLGPGTGTGGSDLLALTWAGLGLREVLHPAPCHPHPVRRHQRVHISVRAVSARLQLHQHGGLLHVPAEPGDLWARLPRQPGRDQVCG